MDAGTEFDKKLFAKWFEFSGSAGGRNETNA